MTDAADDLLPVSHVTIHGHDVTYRRAGHGQAIVLIHGLAGSSRTWQHVHRRLADSFDVIAPDLLGHGESAKPVGDYSPGAYAAYVTCSPSSASPGRRSSGIPSAAGSRCSSPTSILSCANV